MNILHIIGGIAGSVFFWFGVMLDLKSSIRGPYFGTSESTKFLRNADGDIDVTRKWIISGVFFALGWVILLFVHGIVGVLWLFLLGAMSVWQYFENDKKQRKNRDKQIAWLTATAGHSPDDAEALYQQQHFNQLGNIVTPKTSDKYYPLFKWIKGATDEELRRKLVKLANLPPIQWFPTEGKL